MKRVREFLEHCGRDSALLVISMVGTSFDVSARQALDRTKTPPPGKTPDLRVPTWTKSALANGADLIVSEKHDLPIVSFSLTFLGGANQFEPADRTGLASLTAAMMSEGTKTRDGEALSNALQLLGTSVSASVGSESGSIGFVSTTGKFGQTMDILADMLLNSTFPADALERLRAQRLVALTQARAQPGAIAGRVFPKVLYGASHPYGRVATEDQSRPSRATTSSPFTRSTFSPAGARHRRGRRHGGGGEAGRSKRRWRRGRRRARGRPSPIRRCPSAQKTTIYLVDRPGAAQSTVAIGHPGPPRNTPDYYAMQVMNTMLGGMFQSRLNANIREEKGYSYGVTLQLRLWQGPGRVPHRRRHRRREDRCGARRVHEGAAGHSGRAAGDRRGTADGKGLAHSAVAGDVCLGERDQRRLDDALEQGLPDDYYQQYTKAVAAVTKADVLRVAKKYIDIDRLAIVIVGDRASIEGPLKATKIAPIAYLDIEGAPKTP